MVPTRTSSAWVLKKRQNSTNQKSYSLLAGVSIVASHEIIHCRREKKEHIENVFTHLKNDFQIAYSLPWQVSSVTAFIWMETRQKKAVKKKERFNKQLFVKNTALTNCRQHARIGPIHKKQGCTCKAQKKKWQLQSHQIRGVRSHSHKKMLHITITITHTNKKMLHQNTVFQEFREKLLLGNYP